MLLHINGKCWITTGAISGAGTSYPSEAPGVRVTQSLVLCVCFVDRCLSFYLFLLGLYYFFLLDLRHLIIPFDIFKHFLQDLVQSRTKVLRKG
jgi:hypothetical protein